LRVLRWVAGPGLGLDALVGGEIVADVAAGATAGLLGGLLPRPRPVTVVQGPPRGGRDGPRDRPYRGPLL
jgi:hypothetical protein